MPRQGNVRTGDRGDVSCVGDGDDHDDCDCHGLGVHVDVEGER